VDPPDSVSVDVRLCRVGVRVGATWSGTGRSVRGARFFGGVFGRDIVGDPRALPVRGNPARSPAVAIGDQALGQDVASREVARS
jgi:hypothetical protein